MQAQRVLSGTVVDSKTGETLPFVNVVYLAGGHTRTDADGRFSLPYRGGKLRISGIGYETKTFSGVQPKDSLVLKLDPMESDLKAAVVTGKKQKYSRKNNPAVQLMERVIAKKKNSDLKQTRDFYRIDKYSKMTFAFNEVTDKIFEEGKFKRLPFLKDHVEVCNETGKLILPISVDETASYEIYRKDPETTKTIVTGQKTTGINEIFQTGDMVNVMLKDAFTDVNLYKDKIRLLRSYFASPIATHGALGFYRYFIIDTLEVAGHGRCIRVDLTPNNPHDVGFSGSLYIAADSTDRLCKADLTIPKASTINFVDDLRLIQEYEPIDGGEQVLRRADMLVQLKLLEMLQKFQVKLTTQYIDYTFEPIPDKEFNFKGETKVMANAQMQSDKFWEERRTEHLTKTEGSLKQFINRLTQVKGFKPVLWIAKAFIENNVETTMDPEKPSKVDIGPINTMFTHNDVDGFRLRLSALTTANLSPHLFAKGYVAYGFKDKKVKGMGELTYSFNKKDYLPREFPVNNLTFNYTRDVMAPSDKFLPTDKDNVFVSFKWADVTHMMYYETYRLLWEREWLNDLRFHVQLRTSKDKPTSDLFYQPLSGGAVSQDARTYNPFIRTYDFTVGLRYNPGAKWMNTKQHRYASNSDAPVYELTHTSGLYNFGGKSHPYNLTEAYLYRRLWLNSWGKMNFAFKGGVAWNKVPFPLLSMPAANLSYIKEKEMFGLIDNMEFMNDRYVSFFYSWDLNGKLFNRIPLLKNLNWREYIGCNVLWGTLTDKNNPFLAQNANSPLLLHFPGRFNPDGTFKQQSYVMNPRRPYVEVTAGIHNIFKLFHIEYVHRLTYLREDTRRWGLRIMIRAQF